MVLKIDFDSEEALYTQLCNQIICGIAMDVLHDGDSLPSVRQLADEIGINHAYSQQGICCIETGRISAPGPQTRGRDRPGYG